MSPSPLRGVREASATERGLPTTTRKEWRRRPPASSFCHVFAVYQSRPLFPHCEPKCWHGQRRPRGPGRAPAGQERVGRLGQGRQDTTCRSSSAGRLMSRQVGRVRRVAWALRVGGQCCGRAVSQRRAYGYRLFLSPFLSLALCFSPPAIPTLFCSYSLSLLQFYQFSSHAALPRVPPAFHPLSISLSCSLSLSRALSPCMALFILLKPQDQAARTPLHRARLQ